MATDREIDSHSGTQTTGHEWDGIRELDTPLPRWWLYIFYGTIAIAVVIWVLMPAWPGLTGYTHGVLGQSDRANVAAEIAKLKASRAKYADQLLTKTPDEIEKDPELFQFSLAAGEAAFGDNCATCHGVGGRGAKGYPSLADDVWLWGGSYADIEHTIRVGARNDNPDARMSQMPAFGRDGILKPDQVDDLTDYVLSLSGGKHNADAAARGAMLYANNCVSCHGANGEGMRNLGAPSLRDHVWLYGGSGAEVRGQIWSGRGGVMPTWESRLDPATIRALTIYVHSLGGGEPTPPATANTDQSGAPATPTPAPASSPIQ